MKKGLKFWLAAVPVIGVAILTVLKSALREDRGISKKNEKEDNRLILKGPPYFTRMIDPNKENANELFH